jgi:hypothetical protein
MARRHHRAGVSEGSGGREGEGTVTRVRGGARRASVDARTGFRVARPWPLPS